jgi:hypothetical protein
LQRRQVYYVPGFKFAVLVKRNFGVWMCTFYGSARNVYATGTISGICCDLGGFYLWSAVLHVDSAAGLVTQGKSWRKEGVSLPLQWPSGLQQALRQTPTYLEYDEVGYKLFND